jgi:hypothetical protein
LSDPEKAVITVACQRLIDEELEPGFLPTIRPTQFNYLIVILGKWHGNRYRFVQRYRSGQPETLVETIEGDGPLHPHGKPAFVISLGPPVLPRLPSPRVFTGCFQSNCDRLVFSNTGVVYGDAASKPISEAAICEPVNPYGMKPI